MSRLLQPEDYYNDDDDDDDYDDDNDQNYDEDAPQEDDNNNNSNNDDDGDRLERFQREQEEKRKELAKKGLGQMKPVRKGADVQPEVMLPAAAAKATKSSTNARQSKATLRSPVLSDSIIRFEPVAIGGKNAARFQRVDAACAFINRGSGGARLAVWAGENAEDSNLYGDGFFVLFGDSNHAKSATSFDVQAMPQLGRVPKASSGHSMSYHSSSDSLFVMGGQLKGKLKLIKIEFDNNNKKT